MLSINLNKCRPNNQAIMHELIQSIQKYNIGIVLLQETNTK